MNMVTRSKRSIMKIVILLLFFSNVSNCYASRPLSTTSYGLHVAGGNGNTILRVVELKSKLVRFVTPEISITAPPGDTGTHYP